MAKVNSFVIPGAVAFGATKFVFDRSTKTALIVGVIVGAIGVAIASINLPQPTQTTL